MLAKWLLLLLVVAAGVMFWRAAQRQRMDRRDSPEAPAERPPEAMRRCAHCGVHVPASEAVVRAGQPYCCEAHAAGSQ